MKSSDFTAKGQAHYCVNTRRLIGWGSDPQSRDGRSQKVTRCCHRNEVSQSLLTQFKSCSTHDIESEIPSVHPSVSMFVRDTPMYQNS